MTWVLAKAFALDMSALISKLKGLDVINPH